MFTYDTHNYLGRRATFFSNKSQKAFQISKLKTKKKTLQVIPFNFANMEVTHKIIEHIEINSALYAKQLSLDTAQTNSQAKSLGSLNWCPVCLKVTRQCD